MNFEILKNFMDELSVTKSPGNAISVYVDGKEVFRYASGYSSIENKTAMTGDEYFNIYSCSKVTTVTAALQLLERGKFLLSDPLYEYIPEFRDMYIKTSDGDLIRAKNKITIGNLFTMRAGFTYDMYTDAFKKANELTGGKMDTVQVIKCLASDPLSFEPGTRWQYSLCHDVLAAVVSVVSGKKFREYVKENIFEPLGMSNSVYHATDDIKSLMAEQYEFVPNGQETILDIVEAQKSGNATEGMFKNVGKNVGHILGSEYDSGGAGISTTVSDYVLLINALANMGLGANGERILSAGAVELLRTNQLTAEQIEKDFVWKQLLGYGYGLGVRTLLSRAQGGALSNKGEFGWGGAAGATTLSDPSNRLAVFFAQHTLNPREEYYQPRLRNAVYACLER